MTETVKRCAAPVSSLAPVPVSGAAPGRSSRRRPPLGNPPWPPSWLVARYPVARLCGFWRNPPGMAALPLGSLQRLMAMPPFKTHGIRRSRLPASRSSVNQVIEEVMTERIRGTNCALEQNRNFGFLTPEPGVLSSRMATKGDVFVHRRPWTMPRSPKSRRATRFEFAIEIGRDDRPRACNLVLVERAQDVVERVGGGW